MPRIQYTAQEYDNMHFIYGECRSNASAATALYRERYPNARHPHYHVFVRVHRCYSEGRISGSGIGGTSSGRQANINTQDIVLDEIQQDPSTSVRTISRRTGIPKTTVHRVLKINKYHPYHIRRVQALQPRDYNARLFFCRQMLVKIEEDAQFFGKILWSDESTLKKDGYFNMHNLHSWQLSNPNLMREERSQYQFKVNYWTGIINGIIIGPFKLPGNLSSHSYLNFLQNDLPNLMEEVPEEVRESHWLQNDGCPAHYSTNVRAYLNATYPNKWIGRLGPILCPPPSPDLSPLDLFY